MSSTSRTRIAAEIEKFSRDAPRWWDTEGPFAPLHRLNPVRLSFIRDQAERHFGLKIRDALRPFTGLSFLDIGCGGGLVCEPLARLGGVVTGVDADPVAIGTAKAHAAQSGLAIDYRNSDASDIKEKFDVVLALEIIEHVAHPQEFVETCAQRVKPGGLVIFSTLNRTPASWALGIIAAEYVLRWVPRGTHDWKKFVKPSELARMGRQAGLTPGAIKGLAYSPVSKAFRLSDGDIGVNYLMGFRK